MRIKSTTVCKSSSRRWQTWNSQSLKKRHCPIHYSNNAARKGSAFARTVSFPKTTRSAAVPLSDSSNNPRMHATVIRAGRLSISRPNSSSVRSPCRSPRGAQSPPSLSSSNNRIPRSLPSHGSAFRSPSAHLRTHARRQQQARHQSQLWH